MLLLIWLANCSTVNITRVPSSSSVPATFNYARHIGSTLLRAKIASLIWPWGVRVVLQVLNTLCYKPARSRSMLVKFVAAQPLHHVYSQGPIEVMLSTSLLLDCLALRSSAQFLLFRIASCRSRLGNALTSRQNNWISISNRSMNLKIWYPY